jgi:hypothetical protein
VFYLLENKQKEGKSMKLIQMIRDNIAIQRAYKKRNRKQTSPNAFWWMSRGERRRRIKEYYKELGMM